MAFLRPPFGFQDRLRNRLGNAAKKIAAVLLGQKFGKVHVGFGHRGLPIAAVDVAKLPWPYTSMTTWYYTVEGAEITPRPRTLTERSADRAMSDGQGARYFYRTGLFVCVPTT